MNTGATDPGPSTSEPWTAADIPDLTERCAFVTGANSGIGLETARVLAARGARVLLGCRDDRRAQEAARVIRSTVPDARLDIVPIDLASLASVRVAAAQVVTQEPRLDLLVNNAGVMALPRQKTADGFEMQFGVNHLGHFALTGLLLELLLATPASRVVTVSSTAHRIGRVDFDNLQGERTYGRWRQYGLSKVANLLFTYELQRRLSRAHAETIAVACHPGIADTALGRDAGPLMKLGGPLMRRFTQPPAAGALPTLRAATDPGVRGGQFYGPEHNSHGAPIETRSSAYSHDTVVARRLWSVSEALTTVTYPR